MTTAGSAVFVDLDRTLLRSASGPVLHEAMEAEGVVPPGRHLPGDQVMYALYNRFGESVPFIGLARAAALLMRGRSVDATRRAAKRAIEPLTDLVQPWAPAALAEHRAAGRAVVLATTSPEDLVAPLAGSLGFDDVIATRYGVADGRYTGRIEGPFVWGTGKLRAVGEWASRTGTDLGSSHAYSDSIFDLPMLLAVGHPHPLNADARLAAVALARRWALENWDRPPGIPSVVGFEPYHLVRPFVRPEAFPYARFVVSGVEHVPDRGPVLLASNHRSYFDVAALALVAARLGRPVRFLAKQEIFDAPVVRHLARALGGIPVERGRTPGGTGATGEGAGATGEGGSGGGPMRQAAAALRAGEVVFVLPQGTIPRGERFFDPVLHGRTGAARLAAETGAPVVPIGLWGTEQVWPRSSRVPNVAALHRPPAVSVAVGEPVPLGLADAVSDTTAIMAAITDLLPPEVRLSRIPTEEDLARTRPPA
jgi:putative phosphoserine phosphatase / 1-acylglycerol-3-phosphate O-acyltransferase